MLVEPEVVYPLCLPVEERWAQLHAYGALTLVNIPGGSGTILLAQAGSPHEGY